MDIKLNDSEAKILTWLHENAKGYGEHHKVANPDKTIHEHGSSDQAEYSKSCTFLQHFKLIGCENDHRGVVSIWLTPEGENYHRLQVAARSAASAKR